MAPKAHAQSGNGTVVYTYDALGRVTGASYDNNTTITYSYDAAGNRIQQSVAIGAAPGTPPSPPPSQGLLPGSTQWTTNGTSIYYNGGHVGIGTSSPGFSLHISAPGPAVAIETTGGEGQTAAGLQFLRQSVLKKFFGLDGFDNFFIFQGNGANDSVADRLFLTMIAANGFVGIGGVPSSNQLEVTGSIFATGTVSWTSDRRLKKEIKPLALDGLGTVAKLKPVSFAWKAPKDDGMKGTQFGFIAQDVEKLLPQVVLTANDKDKTKRLKYDELIPVLTLAIQQLKAANDSQAAEIKTLQEKIGKLEARQMAASNQ